MYKIYKIIGAWVGAESRQVFCDVAGSWLDSRISTRQERELAIAIKGKTPEGLSFTTFADTWGAYYSAEYLYLQTTTKVQK